MFNRLALATISLIIAVSLLTTSLLYAGTLSYSWISDTLSLKRTWLVLASSYLFFLSSVELVFQLREFHSGDIA
jgi:hypothetical protein